MTNEELVKLIQSGNDREKNTEKLYAQVENLIKSVVSKYNYKSEFEDLMQEAYFGFANAIENYSPGLGSSFTTYLTYWIKQAVFRYLYGDSTIKLPENVKTNIIKYKKLQEQFKKIRNVDPPDLIFCQHLNISHNQLESLRKIMFKLDCISLDNAVGEDGENTISDFIPDETDHIAELIEDVAKQEASKIIWDSVDELPPKRAEIITKYYREGKLFTDIAKARKCSNETVRRDHEKALKELKSKKKLRSLALDVYSLGVRSVGVKKFHRTGMSSTEIAAFKDLGIWH